MSAQKQCPKCGEKNPAEAVMCWACYTSLSGGVAAPVGLAPTGDPAAMANSGEKKKIEPKQLAIIGVGLVVLLGVGAKTMLGGGEESSDDGGIGIVAPNKTPPPSAGSVTVASGPAAPVGGGNNPAAPASVAVVEKIPYSMVVTPSLRYTTATAAIVPTQNDVKMGEAKGLAIFAHHQLDRIKKYESIEIFVFNDAAAGQSFANYLSQQRNAPLQDSDYTSPALTSLWPKAIVRYQSAKGRVTYSYPQTNPDSFWKSTSSS